MTQALDTFDTAVVSPIHYAMFTSFTIFASVIMFKVFLLEFKQNLFGVSESLIYNTCCMIRIGLARVLAALHQNSVDL